MIDPRIVDWVFGGVIIAEVLILGGTVWRVALKNKRADAKFWEEVARLRGPAPKERKHKMKPKDLLQHLEKADRTQEFLEIPGEVQLPVGSPWIPSQVAEHWRLAQVARQQNQWAQMSTAFTIPTQLSRTSFAGEASVQGTTNLYWR